MKDLLLQIVKGIVNDPTAVSIEERDSVDFPGLTILEITVADDDKGILIGRRGRTINAIRDLMTISAIRNEKKVKVLVKDDRPKEDRPKRESKPVEVAPKVEAVPEVEEEKTQPGNSVEDIEEDTSSVIDYLSDDEL